MDGWRPLRHCAVARMLHRGNIRRRPPELNKQGAADSPSPPFWRCVRVQIRILGAENNAITTILKTQDTISLALSNGVLAVSAHA